MTKKRTALEIARQVQADKAAGDQESARTDDAGTTEPGAPAEPFATTEAAEAFCAEFYQVMEKLRQIVDEETRHLKAMNIPDAEHLQKQKTALASVYVKKISEFKVQARSVRELVPEAIPFLAEAHRQMRDVLLANETVLEQLRAVSSGLVAKTAERMAQKAGGPRTYARPGAEPQKSGAAPVAVNRRA